MNTSRSGGRLGALRDGVKSELLADTRRGDGTYALTVGVISGLTWFFLVYVVTGQSSWDTRFLVTAICFLSWGVADLLPRNWRIVAAILRAAVLVFLLTFGVWILFDLLTDF